MSYEEKRTKDALQRLEDGRRAQAILLSGLQTQMNGFLRMLNDIKTEMRGLTCKSNITGGVSEPFTLDEFLADLVDNASINFDKYIQHCPILKKIR